MSHDFTYNAILTEIFDLIAIQFQGTTKSWLHPRILALAKIHTLTGEHKITKNRKFFSLVEAIKLYKVLTNSSQF